MLGIPSLGWQRLKDVYYSLQTCYDGLDWSVGNLYRDFRVVVSSTSTLVAVASKHVQFPSFVDVYSLKGTKVWSFAYHSSDQDHIVDFGLNGEDLCILFNNQRFRYYHDFEGTFNEYSFLTDLMELDEVGCDHSISGGGGGGNVSKKFDSELQLSDTDGLGPQNHVLQSYFWGRWLVLELSGSLVLCDLNTFANFRIPFYSHSVSKIKSLSLLSAQDNQLEILVGYNNTILSISVDVGMKNYEIVDQGLTEGPFSNIKASPNGLLVAVYNDQTKKIFVLNKKFDHVLLEYDTSNESVSPFMIEWCGNDAIILSLRDELKLIGPGQDSISFFYDIIENNDLGLNKVLEGNLGNTLEFTIPILKTEVDGLKVITSDKVEFLSRVPTPSINLYQIGSTHPGCILLDSLNKLATHPSKSDYNISILKTDKSLLEAMNNCLDAALVEFNPVWQKKLLKAASLGKIYYDEYFNADRLVEVINTLKVLNQIRSLEVGIFLTYDELKFIGWEELIRMMVRRKMNVMALKIVELLGLKNFKKYIYIDWCCSKIRKELAMSDEDLLEIIRKKLLSSAEEGCFKSRNFIPIEKISQTAYEEGRHALCQLLITMEPSISRRITQFLKYGNKDLAVIEAVKACDYDLSILLLLHLNDTLKQTSFFKVLHQNEGNGNELQIPSLDNDQYLHINGDIISNLWIQSKQEGDELELEKYYSFEDRIPELNTLKLKQYLANTNESKALESSSHYTDFQSQLLKVTQTLPHYKGGKGYRMQLDVLELQKRLTDTYQTSFFSCHTHHQILTKLVTMNQTKQASKLVKELKFPVGKFWHLVLSYYAKRKEFDKLHQFILSNNNGTQELDLKSPIGFSPIVETCLMYHAPKETISIYIKNSIELSYTERIEKYLQNDDHELAANEALKHKDHSSLTKIHEAAQNEGASGSLLNLIKGYMNRLGH